MKASRMFIVLALMLGVFGTQPFVPTRVRAEAQAPASEFPAEPAPINRSSDLEARYVQRYRQSVERETARVEESFGSLYAGVVAVLGVTFLLAMFSLINTYRQAGELRRLAAMLKSE